MFGVRQCHKFIILHINIQLFNHYLLKRLPVTHELNKLSPLSEISDHKYKDLFVDSQFYFIAILI